jgi:hypothetical protein
VGVVEKKKVMAVAKSRKKKNKHRKEKNAENGRNLPFFSRFCIWDEVFFLSFPFHVPSMLSFPPSSSLVSHVSLKLYATQA